jgi:glutamate-ammonia-ligase adenylyltransferase
LLMEKLPDLPRLEKALGELTHGAEDLEPILLSFKHVQHLRVGVRDLVGKDDIQDTHRALADVAEVCLKQIAAGETVKLREKWGQPTIGPPKRESDAEPVREPWEPLPEDVGAGCELVVLALGKLGGREPNYHSDLDLVFLYEADGSTTPLRRGSTSTTSNTHFFSELGQRIIKTASQFGPHGRLYEVDPRLRPTGRSGALALPFDGFVRYFREGAGQLWERLALCKARVILGSPVAAERAMAAVVASIYCRPWRQEDVGEILAMRERLESSASADNLKRGPGGTIDTEFVVEMLTLKHGAERPEIRIPGTLDALAALTRAGVLATKDAEFLAQSYRFQRSVEARIRLMDSAGRHEFPDEPRELEKLAFLLDYASAEQLAREVKEIRLETRAHFDRLFAAAAQN